MNLRKSSRLILSLDGVLEHLLESDVWQAALPHSLESPNDACLLHERSSLAPSPDGVPLLFEYQDSSFDKGCCGANSPLFDVDSLDVRNEVAEVVDGLRQLAILELEVDQLDSLREFEV